MPGPAADRDPGIHPRVKPAGRLLELVPGLDRGMDGRVFAHGCPVHAIREGTNALLDRDF